MSYRVVRFYASARIRRRVILSGLTLDEAQSHCRNPETSSTTAQGKTACARTRELGEWFDGYEKE